MFFSFLGFGSDSFSGYGMVLVSRVVLDTPGGVREGDWEGNTYLAVSPSRAAIATVIIMLCGFPSLLSRRRLLLWEGKKSRNNSLAEKSKAGRWGGTLVIH